MTEHVAIYCYRSGEVISESTGVAMVKLYDALRTAGLEPVGSTTHFQFSSDGFVFSVQLEKDR